MTVAGQRSWLSRHALALWFGALGLLAALRVAATLLRGGELDATGWAWLAGALLLCAVGVVLAWRQARRR